jgi:hypothetical protein
MGPCKAVAPVAVCFARVPCGVAHTDTMPVLPLVPVLASAGARAPHRLASGVAPNCVLRRHTRRTGSGLRPNRPGETFSDSPETRPFRIGAL